MRTAGHQSSNPVNGH